MVGGAEGGEDYTRLREQGPIQLPGSLKPFKPTSQPRSALEDEQDESDADAPKTDRLGNPAGSEHYGETDQEWVARNTRKSLGTKGPLVAKKRLGMLKSQMHDKGWISPGGTDVPAEFVPLEQLNTRARETRAQQITNAGIERGAAGAGGGAPVIINAPQTSSVSTTRAPVAVLGNQNTESDRSLAETHEW